MALLLDYLTHNFITLMILASLTVTIFVNKRLAVPATGYFAAGIVTLLLITVVDTVGFQLEQGRLFIGEADRLYQLRVAMTALQKTLCTMSASVSAAVNTSHLSGRREAAKRLSLNLLHAILT